MSNQQHSSRPYHHDVTAELTSAIKRHGGLRPSRANRKALNRLAKYQAMSRGIFKPASKPFEDLEVKDI